VSDVQSVIAAAQRLNSRDEVSLEVLLGLRDLAIKKDPALKDDPDFEPLYESKTMGGLDIRAIGRSILNEWNKQLFGIVCGSTTANESDRKAVLDSLNLGEAAMIAAVAGALLSLGAWAALAAAAAPLIVKRFIEPAGQKLCAAWSEAIKDSN
jgi:hypothetical protein